MIPESNAVALKADAVKFFQTMTRHRALIAQLVGRDLSGSFVGHGLGSLWVYLQPAIVVVSYILVFGVVIGSKIAVTSTFPGDYTGYILAGLVPWLMTANALGRAPSVFMVHANLVKQVVFPVEVLPIASTVACLKTFLPCFAIVLTYIFIVNRGGSPFVFLLLLALLFHVVFVIGLMLILASITPFVRDLREIVSAYSAVSMYFTPAIYLPDWVPETLRPILYVNPFSYAVWVYQDVLFFGRIEHPVAWLVFGLLAIFSFVFGLRVFNKMRPHLGNVL